MQKKYASLSKNMVYSASAHQSSEGAEVLKWLDRLPEQRFDQLVKLAKAIAACDGAYFSFIDDHKLWVKSYTGVTISAQDKNYAFGFNTISAPASHLLIEDTQLDERFNDHEMVVNAPYIRTYLGCKILAKDSDIALGMLSIFYTQLTPVSASTIEKIQQIADIISSEIIYDHQLVEAHKDLLRKTLYDPLTGLPGHQLFVQELTQRCECADNANWQLLMLNIQRFRLVNRIFGLTRGDIILQVVSTLLQQVLPDNHFVSRIRDDRFAFLIRNQGQIDSAKVLLQLHTLLENPLLDTEPSLKIACSVGIVSITPEFNFPDDLINRANTAMHAAPEIAYGLSIESNEPVHEYQLMRSFEIEKKLSEAISNDQFEMVYQPIVALSDGKMSGFEALIRWPWKNGEYISPMEFIPVAESSGLIKSLTRWIIRKTCHDFAAFRHQWSQNIYMSVNISSADLLDPGFSEYILSVLDEMALPAHILKLEVTEHSVIHDIETAIAQMRVLQMAGIRFAIDDFGTGHASLRYLQLLPAAYLKIDRSFIGGVTELERDAAITRATIALAHSLNKNVIAEGVECKEQADFLRQHQAEFAQGWFYARPMPIGELASYRPPNMDAGISDKY